MASFEKNPALMSEPAVMEHDANETVYLMYHFVTSPNVLCVGNLHEKAREQFAFRRSFGSLWIVFACHEDTL